MNGYKLYTNTLYGQQNPRRFMLRIARRHPIIGFKMWRAWRSFIRDLKRM